MASVPCCSVSVPLATYGRQVTLLASAPTTAKHPHFDRPVQGRWLSGPRVGTYERPETSVTERISARLKIQKSARLDVRNVGSITPILIHFRISRRMLPSFTRLSTISMSRSLTMASK